MTGSHDGQFISEGNSLLLQDIFGLAVPGSTTPFVIELFVVRKYFKKEINKGNVLRCARRKVRQC
jgi:hypothetical protein